MNPVPSDVMETASHAIVNAAPVLWLENRFNELWQLYGKVHLINHELGIVYLGCYAPSSFTTEARNPMFSLKEYRHYRDIDKNAEATWKGAWEIHTRFPIEISDESNEYYGSYEYFA